MKMPTRTSATYGPWGWLVEFGVGENGWTPFLRGWNGINDIGSGFASTVFQKRFCVYECFCFWQLITMNLLTDYVWEAALLVLSPRSATNSGLHSHPPKNSRKLLYQVIHWNFDPAQPVREGGFCRAANGTSSLPSWCWTLWWLYWRGAMPGQQGTAVWSLLASWMGTKNWMRRFVHFCLS